MPSPTSKPKNYFLNESHELSVEAKKGGGPQLPILDVDWARRGQHLRGSLQRINQRATESRDPLARQKYYLLAGGVREIVKASKAKDAVRGQKLEAVVFSGKQSRFFGRIGLELIEVHPSGAATVFATPERMEQLISRTSQLAQLGKREQANFAPFESFDWLPGKLKYDSEWLDEMGHKTVEGYIKLQPLISEIEADLVIRAIDQFFRELSGQALAGKGRSYLGRFFLRAKLNAQTVRNLADEFTSIQAIYPPIIAFAESIPHTIETASNPSLPVAGSSLRGLPCIAVVDTAVPEEHRWLRSHRRAIVRPPDCSNTENDHHGSMVASRVVFGDADLDNSAPPSATCSFLEVRVGTGRPHEIRCESVSGALLAAITAAPDVRVFNLSFDKRLDGLPSKQRGALLQQIEEIDNFAFDKDVIVVVAAGNAPRNIVPTPRYPHHIDSPDWTLQSFPRSFNALTCGGVNARLTAGGLTTELDAPSPFTRIGPGFAKSPKPDFCDSAGDRDANYGPLPSSGVWGFSALGDAMLDCGTSFAAPILLRFVQ